MRLSSLTGCDSNMQIRFSVAMRDLIEFLFVLNGSQQHIVDNLPKDDE
jgi:hypothetical protein